MCFVTACAKESVCRLSPGGPDAAAENQDFGASTKKTFVFGKTTGSSFFRPLCWDFFSFPGVELFVLQWVQYHRLHFFRHGSLGEGD